MVRNLMQSGLVDVAGKVRSLPRALCLGDFYSGAGTFFNIAGAVQDTFHKLCRRESINFEDCRLGLGWLLKFFFRFIVFKKKSNSIQFNSIQFNSSPIPLLLLFEAFVICLLRLLQMKHHFMCENTGFKQRHLESVLDHGEDLECCLFSDATKVFTGDERDCIRHKGCCVSCWYFSHIFVVLHVSFHPLFLATAYLWAHHEIPKVTTNSNSSGKYVTKNTPSSYFQFSTGLISCSGFGFLFPSGIWILTFLLTYNVS